MVRITRVHTGVGDKGRTVHLSGENVSKSDTRLEVVGTIDELNSLVGVTRMELTRFPSTTLDGGPRATVLKLQSSIGRKLALLQQELFDLGAECSTTPDSIPEGMVVLGVDSADRLLTEMDEWLSEIPPLESFILPTGNPVVANLHLARAVCRRCERRLATLREIDGEDSVREIAFNYLNRLSDWMFVLLRLVTSRLGEDEALWTPLGKR
ncbi:MAG: cob(I)yrinic acid a,c-diamide adenosyltransferase [Euryarchaeota archaeon]|nr:cob(I)yrinic acid a,c-diamide adenosyltransferase [Euryarchaeota archaeon]